MKTVRVAVLAGGGAVALALAIGCGDEVSKPAVRPAVSQAGGAARVDGAVVRGESAKARFHRVNRLDWIGVAHNAAMTEIGTRLARGQVHGNVCGEILDLVAARKQVPAAAQVSGAEMRALASRVLASNGMCPSSAAAVHPAAFLQSSDGLSAEASALVSDIYAAVGASPTSGDLAGALLPILDRANQLAPAEADLIIAGASVAQSSMEHWESTLTDEYVNTETNAILSSYGGCFSNYATAPDGVTGCMGLHALPLAEPTSHRSGGGRSPVYRLAAAYASCPRPNGGEVVRQDVTGAIGGGVAAIWTGGGVLAGAIGGAMGMSAAEMIWQLGVGAWCYGSAAIKGVPLQQT